MFILNFNPTKYLTLTPWSNDLQIYIYIYTHISLRLKCWYFQNPIYTMIKVIPSDVNIMISYFKITPKHLRLICSPVLVNKRAAWELVIMRGEETTIMKTMKRATKARVWWDLRIAIVMIFFQLCHNNRLILPYI